MNRGNTHEVFLQGEVLHLRLKSESQAFLCGFSPAARIAVLLCADSLSTMKLVGSIDQLLEKLRLLCPAQDLLFKAVGSRDACLAIRRVLESRKQILSRECEMGLDGEAFFYGASGRLRVRVTSETERRRVLIVDDSRSIRRLLRGVLEADPDLEVVGDTGEPRQVEQMVFDLKPHVVTLDIRMPEIDGLTLLRRLTQRFAVPAVVVSSVNQEEAYQVLNALELGAVDYIQKPVLADLPLLAPEIRARVRMAARAVIRASASEPLPRLNAEGKRPAEVPVVIGASTGGPEALKRVLSRLPSEIPPIVVALHIPKEFSKVFADRLQSLCAFPVQEAIDGEPVCAGKVWIAPGGKQTQLVREKSKLVIRVAEDLSANGYAPSIDGLFGSAALACGARCVGILLTGMGNDGAHGLNEMRLAGAMTIAQDEASSIVFGMPKAALELGAVKELCALDDIPARILHGGVWRTPKVVAAK